MSKYVINNSGFDFNNRESDALCKPPNVYSVHNTRVSSGFMCRSPWTNQYDPPLEDGTLPSEKLRSLEVDANTAFNKYRDL